MSKLKPGMRARYLIFIVAVFGMFAYLTYGLVQLQLVQSEEYSETAESRRTKTITLRGKRGMITDADSVILANDEYIYNVTFYKDASSLTRAQYAVFSQSIVDTIEIIERNGGALCVDFVIERDPETNEWIFNFGSGVSESVLATREKQWRSNNYLTSMTSYETAEQCIEALKNRFRLANTQAEADAWEAAEEASGLSHADSLVVDETTMLKVMAVYSEMQMNVFNSQPITIAENVKYETVIEVETRSMNLSGMEIAVGTKRVYPRSTLAAQVIGYIGAIPSQSSWETYQAKGYSYNDKIGRDGIESSMEDWLTQNSSLKQGSRVVERDNLSQIVRELSYTEPQDGNNVKLTLIASYQQQAERAIADNVASTRTTQEAKMVNEDWLEDNKSDIANRNWEKYPLALAEHGTMVVVDMEGRVLAMANYPTYDLNALVAGGKEAMEILGDSRNLLMNYAIHARGTPGSIFKMVTSIAALAEGELTPTERINDEGYFTEYNKDISTAPKCWISAGSRWQHQNQTIVEGLSNSCNYFFYTLGSRLGEERLYRYASLLGLTSKTGLDLPGEVRSVVGCQTSLYDTTKAMNEASQDTSLPIIVFNAIKTHLKNCGASRGMEYTDERLSACAKRLMDMAVNYPEGEWLDNMRTILMEELNMTKEMVYLQAVIGDTYLYMNDVKWGGAQTILTAIGQSVTVLTPAAVARYVCAVANGGKVYNLSIVDAITSPEGEILSQRTPTLINDLDYPEYWSLIHQGMKGVVDESGTARKYFKNWEYREQIAAKTGTAEVTTIDLENNAWFVAFAPYDEPEIAVAVFIPNGFSGGEASLAAREFIDWYMNQKNLRTTDYTLPYGNSVAP